MPNSIIDKAKIYCKDILYRYYSVYKATKIRSKKTPIRVVFVLYDLSTWKTENLYLAMKADNRFYPILAITRNTNLLGHELDVIRYVEEKKYEYVFLDEEKTICEQLNPDLINYQRPYYEEPPKHRYLSNMSALHFFIDYGIHSVLEDWAVNRSLEVRAWQDYFENELCAEANRKHSRHKGRNIVVTGTPIMDTLASPKEQFKNPWKNTDNRKRIIWAPHHTIGNIHDTGMAFGTFLEIAEDMLKIAQEYQSSIYFAFKPHPQLYKNLVSVWGKERTDQYYAKWESMDNSQVEKGDYMGLFKYSDAMIHDCCTFTVEYLAIGNPVLYMVRDGRENGNVDDCSKRSFELHYHGKTSADIRKFLDNVIIGTDPRKEERMEFVNKYLRPPHGKTACENIMNAILGVEEYKNCR